MGSGKAVGVKTEPERVGSSALRKNSSSLARGKGESCRADPKGTLYQIPYYE